MNASQTKPSLWIAGAGAVVAIAIALLNPVARLDPGNQIYEFLDTLTKYVVFATSFYLVFWVFLKKTLQHRKLSRRATPKRDHMLREAIFSTATQVIFITFDVWILYLVPQSEVNKYADVQQYGWGYYAALLFIVFVLHDAYFYWAHRAMHHPWLYGRVHKVHHESTDPTPYTAYHFHPLEAVAEAGVNIPMIALFCLLPWHASIPIVWAIGQLVFNIIGHLGYEIYPSWWNRVPGLRFKTAGMHHYMHHQLVGGNYGLYFRWWDKMCGTEFPNYEANFDRLFAKAAKDAAARKDVAISAPPAG